MFSCEILPTNNNNNNWKKENTDKRKEKRTEMNKRRPPLQRCNMNKRREIRTATYRDLSVATTTTTTIQREMHNNEHWYLEYLEIRNETLTVSPYVLQKIKGEWHTFRQITETTMWTLWEIGNSYGWCLRASVHVNYFFIRVYGQKERIYKWDFCVYFLCCRMLVWNTKH